MATWLWALTTPGRGAQRIFFRDMAQDEAAAAAAEPVVSLPVYVSASVPPSSRLELFQYPLYARGRPLPVPATAAQRGQRVTSRWRPHANRVEMEIPLDMRETVYNHDRGMEWAENSASMGVIPTPGEPIVKQEDRAMDAPSRFDRMRLESHAVPNATHYMVGTVRDGELHLVPLDAVLQLRPSMQHVDLMSQAEDQNRRMPTSDDEGDAQDARRAHVVPLNVSMRTEAQARTALTPRFGAQASSGLATQRDAEAERWVDLRFSEAQGADQLLAQQREPLACTTHIRDLF